MQGKLSEIDIRSILQLIELGQRTGELFVESYSSHTTGMTGGGSNILDFRGTTRVLQDQSWFVFFLNGQIIYATDASSNLSRLRDHLRRYKVDTTFDSLQTSSIAVTNAPEYGYLWALLESHAITPSQGRSIIQSMVHETLFDLLSLHQGAFIFELGSALTPQLTTSEIGPLVARVMKEIQEWKQFHPHIQSPDQCLVITEPESLREVLPEHIYRLLHRWVDGKTSIRQMARFLNRNALMVARAVYPYVQQGLVQLTNDQTQTSVFDEPGSSGRRWLMQPWETTRPPLILCIDDGIAICEVVKYILKQHGYPVATVSDPLAALRLVFQVKPDLILCDIAMPELDGYEICAMLRKSTAFRQTPIVMLTGKDGFIDRVKARMVGATDYLTKPFGESELLMLVEKHVGPGNLDQMQVNQAIANPNDDLSSKSTSPLLP